MHLPQAIVYRRMQQENILVGICAPWRFELNDFYNFNGQSVGIFAASAEQGAVARIQFCKRS
jgi:hypothetical protein